MTTLAKPTTIAVIDLILQGDEHLSDQIRRRALALISTGSTDPDGCTEEMGAKAFANLLGISESALNRWQKGQTKSYGPWPFTILLDLKGARRYLRSEGFAHRHNATNRGVRP
jgi:hypothetical protein